MNIFEFAREKEKQAEAIYRKLSESALSEGMRVIYSRLAEAENRHCEILLKMEAAQKVDMVNTDILTFAQKTIHQMKSGGGKFEAATEEIEVYTLAQAQEVEAEALYREHAEKSTNDQQRKVFLALANEEHQHATILENIADFISFPAKHPEDAEFHAQEEK